uniref:Uncharacterized protein n=1 Tax=Stegastes partitus TaxID=144197 RepID=A0A3B5AK21_9TELE
PSNQSRHRVGEGVSMAASGPCHRVSPCIALPIMRVDRFMQLWRLPGDESRHPRARTYATLWPFCTVTTQHTPVPQRASLLCTTSACGSWVGVKQREGWPLHSWSFFLPWSTRQTITEELPHRLSENTYRVILLLACCSTLLTVYRKQNDSPAKT